jgi:asparagine synthase (glutamine-hydrolysing)
VLSGHGGEEATGGSPLAPIPQLQDLVRTGRFLRFASELNAWAKQRNKTRTHLCFEVLQGFLRPFPIAASRHMGPAPWFDRDFIRRNIDALDGDPARVRIFGPLPSFQHAIRDLNDVARRALSCFGLTFGPLRDLRYPYLDRDLLEFMYAVPPEQVVRLRERRSLLMRALAGIVPDEILNRTKPAVRSFRANQRLRWPIALTGNCSLSSSLGVVDQYRFVQAIERAGRNEAVSLGHLRRTITFEAWLQHLARYGVSLAARSSDPGTRSASRPAQSLLLTSQASFPETRYQRNRR